MLCLGGLDFAFDLFKFPESLIYDSVYFLDELYRGEHDALAWYNMLDRGRKNRDEYIDGIIYNILGADSDKEIYDFSRSTTEASLTTIAAVKGGAKLATKGIKAFKKKPKVTQTSDICGWRVGDPINHRTAAGNVPKWDTVRNRYWKNEAYYHPEKYRTAQIQRMKKGNAPQIKNKRTGKMESIELHHSPPRRDGGLYDFVPVTPAQHAKIDKYRRLKKET